MSLFDEDDNDFDMDTSYDAMMSESSSEGLKEPKDANLLISHDKIEQDMLSMWNAERMPHALIFNGLKGIGKATFAYRLARFVMKESEGGDAGAGLFGGDDAKPESLSIPNDHHVFSKISSGGHPDMMVVGRPFDERKGEYKNDIPVDEIRKVAPFLRKTSSNGGWRVVIIDDANLMNRNGQNALLKILEEPPQKALLILITHGAGGLLPTIRSRCRFVPFETLNDNQVQDLLEKSAQGSPVMPADKDILCAMASGSAGKAIELHQEGGLESVHIVLDALGQLHDLSESQIDALALSYGKSGDKKIIEKFSFIIDWWFRAVIDLTVKGLRTTQIGGIDITVPRGATLQSLLKLHEDVDAHIKSSMFGNLDKRYMIFKTLRMIQG